MCLNTTLYHQPKKKKKQKTKTAAAADDGHALTLVYTGIYNWSPTTTFPRVSRSPGAVCRGDLSGWQAAEKEQKEGPAAASRPAIVELLFPGNLHILISWDCQLLHPFVSENIKSLCLAL